MFADDGERARNFVGVRGAVACSHPANYGKATYIRSKFMPCFASVSAFIPVARSRLMQEILIATDIQDRVSYNTLHVRVSMRLRVCSLNPVHPVLLGCFL